MIEIKVHWRFLDDEDEGWRAIRCLYAYLAPDKKEIIYIGKAWGTTVRARWNRSGKENFWNDLEKKRGIYNHFVLLGVLGVSRNYNLTAQLLEDVESLLIIYERPWGNIQSIDSRICRLGLRVRCMGNWPRYKGIYQDIE